MTTIDDRIVAIQFDNRAFESKISETISSLDRLNKSLDFSSSKKNFSDLDAAAKNVNFSEMGDALDNISSKFSALGAIGFTVIQDLTQQVIGFVSGIIDKGKVDVLEPIITGGRQRALNIEQAKFMFEGLGLSVEEGMKNALDAVKGTAFGLDEAAKAAAQFGASGISLGKDMTGALRGVAGAAALTGRGFTEIADIFAGSAGSGKVTNQDLLQFATRGLNAASAVAKVMGTTEANIHKMAAEGKLDFKTFADAMDKAFGKHATEANKTYAGSLANLHAAFSRLGESFIGEQLTQQRDILNSITPVVDALNKALKPLTGVFLAITGQQSKNLVKFFKNLDLSNFKKAVPNFAEALLRGFAGVVQITNTFKRAFREIFPKSTESTLVRISVAIREFSKRFKIGGETLNKVKSIFRGFFAGIAIGIEVIKQVAKAIFGLFGGLAKATGASGGGILNFFANFGESVVNLKKQLVDNKGIQKFFQSIGGYLTTAADAFKRFRDAVASFIDKISGGAIQNFFKSFSVGSSIKRAADEADKGLGRIQSRIQNLKDAWQKIQDFFAGVRDFLKPITDYIQNFFSSLGSKIAQAFQPGDFNSALDLINVGLLGGIVVLFKKFLTHGLKLDFTGGLLDKVKQTFDGLTKTLQSMQLKIKADALIKIAEAVAILVGSLVVLSLIDSKALTKALAALTVSFGELIGVMTAIDKINFSSSIVKINGIAGAMILVATAALILSAAIAVLAHLDLAQLAKGLVGVGVGIGLLVAATRLISDNAKGLITAGTAMIIISTALLIFAGVVKIFATMDTGQLAKGLGSVAVGLALLVETTRQISDNAKGLITSSVAIIAISTALLILAGVVKIFATMSLKELATGFGAIAVGLALMVGALSFITTDTAGLVTASFAMVAISTAILILSTAVKELGKQDLGTLAKGVGAFAAMLLVLVAGVNAMDEAGPGALALIVVAGAMHILAGVLTEIGQLSIAQIATGLITIGAALTVIGVAAAVLADTGALLAMVGLGAALSLIGASFALFGLGAITVAKAFEIMGESGAKGAEGIVKAIKIILTALPSIQKAVLGAVVSFAASFLKAAPLLIRLAGALIEQLLETIAKLAPKIAETGVLLIMNFLDSIRAVFPDVVDTGIEMILEFLHGVEDSIGEITDTAANIIINFMDALTENIPELATHGATLIATFIQGIAEHLPEIIDAGIDIIVKLIAGIASGAVRLANAALKAIVDFLNGLATAINTYAPQIRNAGIRVIFALLNGMSFGLLSGIKPIITWFVGLAGKILGWIGNVGGTLLGKGVNLIQGLWNGIVNRMTGVIEFFKHLGKNIVSWVGDIGEKLYNLGKHIITGLWNGINHMKDWFIEKAKSVAGWFTGALGKVLKVLSPSRVMMEMGVNIVKGLGIGVASMETYTKNSAASLGTAFIDGFSPDVKETANKVGETIKSVVATVNDHISNLNDLSPTITPVVDLSNVTNAGKDVATMFSDATIIPDVSLSGAVAISQATTTQATKDATPASEPASQILNFEQNNYSPKALSANDIYRSTRSQLTLAKEKLDIK